MELQRPHASHLSHPHASHTTHTDSSYFDSAKSEEEASKLPYNDDLGSAEEMDPVELEMTELPCSSRVSAQKQVRGGGGNGWYNFVFCPSSESGRLVACACDPLRTGGRGVDASCALLCF